MRITAVRTYVVDGGFRPWTFVKVETSDPGLVGWETARISRPGTGDSHRRTLRRLRQGRGSQEVEAMVGFERRVATIPELQDPRT